MTGVKGKYELQYKSLKESLKEDLRKTNLRDWNIDGYREYGFKQINNGDYSVKSEQLHIACLALLDFSKQNGKNPESEDEILQCMNLMATKAATYEIPKERLAGLHLKNIFNYANCHLTNVCTLFGGILAQEIIKRTGIYVPIQQWLHYECLATIPTGPVDRVVS